jgi:hypothetical protein
LFAFALFIVLIGLTAAAYKPVLFNWFAGDDMAHVSWLHRAEADHSLIWRNFYANWLDSVGTLFYRPLISVSIYADYLLWHENGLGFHITNLVLHLATGTFLYLFLQRVVRLRFSKAIQNQNPSTLFLFPPLAAGIFLLYPLHAEAVAWMIGRVDVVVTALFCASLLCYSIWRERGTWTWLACALSAMALSLMSKEMAIVLPAVLCAYEYFLGAEKGPTTTSRHGANRKSCAEAGGTQAIPSSPSSPSGPSSSSGTPTLAGGQHVFGNMLVSVWPDLSRSLVNTAPFWILLAGYFCWRRYALGTFLGGYDDSFGLVTSPDVWLKQIGKGLWYLAVPFNEAVFSAHNAMLRVWELIVLFAVLCFACTIFQGRLRKITLFTLGFLFLSLVPVYKIFTINGVLGNSRLAYLATIPFSCLLAWGMCNLTVPIALFHKKVQPLTADRHAASSVWLVTIKYLLACMFLAFCWTGLYKNNQPWAEAGRTLNAVKTAIRTLPLQELRESRSRLIFYGLPEYYKGAYICRNALEFLIDRQIRITRLMESDNSFPLGSLKRDISSEPDKFWILRWNPEKKSLDRITPKFATAAFDRLWTMRDVLPGLKEIPQNCRDNLRWDKAALALTGIDQERVFQLKLPAVPTWNCDFLALSLASSADAPAQNATAADTTAPNMTAANATAAIVTEPNAPALNASAHSANPIVSEGIWLDVRGHSTWRRVHGFPANLPASLPSSSASHQQWIIFCLRSIPEWAFDHETAPELNLHLPANFSATLTSIRGSSAEKLMPNVRFIVATNTDVADGHAIISSQPNESKALIRIDASNVSGAHGTAIEVSKNLIFFTESNPPSPQPRSLLRKSDQAKAEFSIARHELADGRYDVRAWALDGNGNPIGVATDNHKLLVWK